MAHSEVVGYVEALWRFPVKSMQGEALDEAEVSEQGIAGDRAYALVETESGKVVSAKSVNRFPDILRCRAEFLEAPRAGSNLPPIRIVLADGTTTRSDATDVDQVLSSYFGHNVTLARVAPKDSTIDLYHPDIEGAGPDGSRDTTVEQKIGAALFTSLGMPSPISADSFFDVFPFSLITTSTLARFHELRPESRFTPPRFRMNVVMKTEPSGFIENQWVGRELAIGETTRLNVAMPGARCVMTTLAQDDLSRDEEILRTLVKHNSVQIGDMGIMPCAGVFAVIGSAGWIRTGDAVTINGE